MPHIATTQDLSADALKRYDAIIDVRSPTEFAEDHLPGAINLPVLDDAERESVGTHYTQVSVFEARRMGAALVSRNIAAHLESALADKPKDFKPLVYCWRGGMRSNAMSLVLASVGWKTTLIEGGYRTWRRQVVSALEAETPLPVILIDGQTGTAKTAILHALARSGEQVIDLEGLACHRGSIFGDMPGQDQPGQKAFESLLHVALRALDPERPVYVEAESRNVGRRRVPSRLWHAMSNAPRIKVEASTAERARYLLGAYPDLPADKQRVMTALDGLKQFHAKARIADWRSMAEAGDWLALAEQLITEHYDPAYNRARKRQSDGVHDKTLLAPSLDEAGIAQTADAIRQAGPQLLDAAPR